MKRLRLLPSDQDLGWTPYAWLVYLFSAVAWPIFGHAPRGVWILTSLSIVAFLILYFRGYWICGRAILPTIAAITFLGVITFPINPGCGVYFVFAAAFAARTGPGKAAWIVVFSVAAIAASEAWLATVSLYGAIWPVAFSLLIGAINIHYEQVRRSNSRLRLAQNEIEHLAKVAERERIARDLHDVLGHTLSLIILKSELASRLADRDTDRAIHEIRDVERISREALSEVRAAVTGYRSAGLQSELQMSRATLEAAGISVHIERNPVVMSAQEESVLALALREATTNIIRHSDAHNCTIAVQQNGSSRTLMIRDDGKGGSSPEGSGMTGMRERVSAIGGVLERDGSDGMRLLISLPAPEEAQEHRA